MTISKKDILSFQDFLKEEEKSKNTLSKYVRDVSTFSTWLAESPLEKEQVLRYKQILTGKYATRTVNSVLSALNAYFLFCHRPECRVKFLKVQRQIYTPKNKELSYSDYQNLLLCAKKKKNKRLFFILQTIASTGIRISELQWITVQAVKAQCAQISCKGKERVIFLPKSLCVLLEEYCEKNSRKEGPVFLTRRGNVPDRSNLWSQMKRLWQDAGISAEKIYPHNLRHLFARTFYQKEKDIVRLADILGHSSINTTRIYTMESGEEHRKQIENLGLVFCTT